MLEHLLDIDETPYLLNSTVDEDIVFTNDNYKLKFLRLDTTEFKGNVTFDHTNLKCGIYFHKCAFYGNLNFEGVKIDEFGNILHETHESLIFEECTFYGKVVFSKNCSILRNLVFKNQCEFYKSFEFVNSFITEGSLYIEDSSFKSIVDIQRSHFSSQLTISNSKVSSVVRIVSSNANTISFTGDNEFQRGRIELCQVENGGFLMMASLTEIGK